VRIVIPCKYEEHLAKLLAHFDEDGSTFRAGDLAAPKLTVVCDGWGPGAATPHIEHLRTDEPFIFARNVNLGWKEHQEEDYIILMGDDVQPFTVNWIETLKGILDRNPRIGLLAPGVVTPAKHQVVQDPSFWKQEVYLWDRGGIPFVCVMIRRAVWEQIGFLDERFTGYGCEDDDYCYRMRQAGWFTAYTSRALVRHGLGGAPYMTSFLKKLGSDEAVQEAQRQNVKLFNEKWAPGAQP
jgi:hypothetical protein